MKRYLLPLGRSLYGLYAWFAFAVIVVPGALLSMSLPGLTTRRRCARLTARSALAVAGFRLDISGLEHLPPGPCIVAANHASYLDGIVLTALLPPRFAFVTKREITTAPFVGRLLHRLGAEFVERFDVRAGNGDAARMIRNAQAGIALGVFPEGTFTREPGLRPFRRGAFVTAARAGLPVVPVALRGVRTALPAESWLPRRTTLTVIVGPPISPSGRDRAAVQKLSAITRQHILHHCGEPDLNREG